MTKFFMPGAPKPIHKKKPDYHKTVFKQLFDLIKLKHLKYISEAVKQVKADPTSQQIPIDNKAIEKLSIYKAIRKKEMRMMAIYLMNTVLKINNFKSVQKIAQMEIDAQRMVEDVKSRKQVIEFLERMMKSSACCKRVESIGEMCDKIMKKKSIMKQKSKQRKARKLQLRSLGTGEGKTISEQQHADDDDKLRGISTGIRKNEKNYENSEKIEHRQIYNKKQNIREEHSKSRTQFKKTGRDRVRQDKQRKKDGFKQRHKTEVREKQSTKASPFEKPKQVHPSWAAKRQQNKSMFIQQFQGKKILL